MNKYLITLPLAACLMGCQTSQRISSAPVEVVEPAQLPPVSDVMALNIPLRYVNQSLLQDYAEQLTMRLMENIHDDELGFKLAVTSFVDFDETLQTTSQLGNQFSRAMASELRQYGVTLVNPHVMPKLLVQPNGVLSQSRDVKELNGRMSLDYVLTGSLLYKAEGVEISAQIASVDDQTVISAAQTIVPYMVTHPHLVAN